MATVSYDVVTYQIDTVSWDGDNLDEIVTLMGGASSAVSYVGNQLSLFGQPVTVGENIAVRNDDGSAVEGPDGRVGIITDAVLADTGVYTVAV